MHHNCYTTNSWSPPKMKLRIGNHVFLCDLKLLTQLCKTWHDYSQYATNRMPACCRASSDKKVRGTISTCVLNETHHTTSGQSILMTDPSHLMCQTHSSTSHVAASRPVPLKESMSIRDQCHLNNN